MFQGKDIAGNSVTVDPGQQMALTAVVAPPLDLPNPSWSLSGGTPIADWQSGHLTNITNSMLHSTSVTFYLTAPSTSCSVSFGGPDNGGVLWSAGTTININAAPAVTFVADTAEWNAGDEQDYNASNSLSSLYAFYEAGPGWSVGCGYLPRLIAGIHWSSTDWKRKFTGTFSICQLLTWYDCWIKGQGELSPNVQLHSPAQCDSEFPYPDPHDAPELSWPSKKRMGMNFAATDYLMWMSPSPGSIYVPIATFNWGFQITNEHFGSKSDLVNISGGGNVEYISPTTYGAITEPTWTEEFNS